MTLNWWMTIAVAATALAYMGTLAYAAYKSDIKREIYILKALIVAYFVVLAAAVLTGGPVPRSLWLLLRPSLATLFFLLFLSKIIDINLK